MSNKKTGYDKVSEVIGKEMNTAWEKIMTQILTTNGTQLKLTEGVLTAGELDDFRKKLGGAHLGIEMRCVEPEGGRMVSYAKGIPLRTADSGPGTEGVDISIGGTIHF